MPRDAEAAQRERPLTDPMRRWLWRLAQHIHGWSYVNDLAGRSVCRALERRGLVRFGMDEVGNWSAELTSIGELEVVDRWPDSPRARHSYIPPAGGWPKVGDDRRAA